MSWSPSLITSDPNHSIHSCTNHHCRVYCQLWLLQTPRWYRHPYIPDSRLIPRASLQSFLEFVMCFSFTDVCGRGMRDKALGISAWEAVKWGGTFYWNKLLSFTHSRNNRLTDNFLGPDGTENKKHLSILKLRKISSSKCHFPVGYSWIYNKKNYFSSVAQLSKKAHCSYNVDIHMVKNHYTGEQKFHWDKTNKRNYHLKLCMPFVGLVPVPLVLSSLAVLYHMNGLSCKEPKEILAPPFLATLFSVKNIDLFWECP